MKPIRGGSATTHLARPHEARHNKAVMSAWEAEQFPTPGRRGGASAQPRSKSRLTIDLILSWVDAHHAATGKWPVIASGRVRDHRELNWGQVNRALIHGYRGLLGGTTLAD